MWGKEEVREKVQPEGGGARESFEKVGVDCRNGTLGEEGGEGSERKRQ